MKRFFFSVFILVFALHGANGDNSRVDSRRNWRYSVLLQSGDQVENVKVATAGNSRPVCDNALTLCLQRFADTAGTLHWAQIRFDGTAPTITTQMPVNTVVAYMADNHTVAILATDNLGRNQFSVLGADGSRSVIATDGDVLGNGIGTVSQAVTISITPDGRVIGDMIANNKFVKAVYQNGQWQKPFSVSDAPSARKLTPDWFFRAVTDSRGCTTFQADFTPANFRLGCINLANGSATTFPYPIVADDGKTYDLGTYPGLYQLSANDAGILALAEESGTQKVSAIYVSNDGKYRVAASYDPNFGPPSFLDLNLQGEYAVNYQNPSTNQWNVFWGRTPDLQSEPVVLDGDCLFSQCGTSNSKLMVTASNGRVLMNYDVKGFSALVLAERLTPAINTGGVINAPNGSSEMSPGGLASVYGYQLTDGGTSTALFADGKFTSSWTDPSSNRTTKVYVSGHESAMTFTSAGQINFQIPYETPIGTPVPVQVLKGSWASNTEWVTLQQVAPAFYQWQPTGQSALVPIVQNALTGSLASMANPAVISGHYVMYGQGLGPLNTQVPNGTPFSGACNTANPVSINVPGLIVRVDYAGCAPTLIISQLNFTLVGFAGNFDASGLPPVVSLSGTVTVDGKTTNISLPVKIY